MQVIYSIGSKFAGSGIGTIAYYSVRGLHRQGLLHRVLCGAFKDTEIPRSKIRAIGLPDRVLRKLASLDQSGWLWHVQAVLYDAWATRQLEPTDIFHVWGSYGLRSIQRAKAMGALTVLEHASAHPVYRTQLLREEYARWGIPFHVRSAALSRALAEIALVDYVKVPSDFVYRSFVEQGVPSRKLLKVPYGVDLTRFRPAEKTNNANRPFRVLFVGQIGIRKGVPYLLEAWRKLQWRDAELWLVGRLLPEMKPILTRYQNLEGVQLIGHTSDPASVYQQADVFAFPAIEEGSALVTYEAMACGLPVITTPNAGAVMQDGEEGFLVAVRDVEALAERLDRLRGNPPLQRRMSEAARWRAASLSWEDSGTLLVAAYGQVAR
ncbi:MAG: glycosyltransferase family 4 protein [Anaerolineae bacterium]|nr:glycosyltransferase family 4 protein [Anaerolineae bacterium]